MHCLFGRVVVQSEICHMVEKDSFYLFCRAGVIIKEPLVKPKPEIGSGVLTSIDPQSLEDSHIVWVCDVAGIGGLKNAAKRNVKPDQLRPVPLDKCKY